jgi:hypothetical protein
MNYETGYKFFLPLIIGFRRYALHVCTRPLFSSPLIYSTINKQFDIWNDVGYLVETPYSYKNLSVVENLNVLYTYFIYRLLFQKLKLIYYILWSIYRQTA